MNIQTATPRPTPTNITRTWSAALYGDWGEGHSASLHLGTHLITLSADDLGHLSATIDGEAQETIERAVSYLNWARADQTLTYLGEVRHQPTPPDPPVIGKARALCAAQDHGRCRTAQRPALRHQRRRPVRTLAAGDAFRPHRARGPHHLGAPVPGVSGGPRDRPASERPFPARRRVSAHHRSRQDDLSQAQDRRREDRRP